MNEQFDNKLAQSSVEWLNNTICRAGGYSAYTGSLYLQEDTTRSNYKVYASPYRSWIYDECVGVPIPSGFYNQSGQFLTRQSGLIFDFINGRVLSSGNWGGALSGSFCRKEFNVQFTSNEVATLYIDRLFNADPNVDYTKTGVLPYSYTAPIIFVTNSNANNNAFQLGGGLTSSNRTYRLYAITKDNFSQEALVSVLTDTKDTYFPIIPSEKMPLQFYGDLKTGYNYCNLKQQFSCSSGARVKNVYHYKIDQRTINTSAWFGSVYDLELETVRTI
jgi:hypothetical protein